MQIHVPGQTRRHLKSIYVEIHLPVLQPLFLSIHYWLPSYRESTGLTGPLVWCNIVILMILQNIQEGSKLVFSVRCYQNLARKSVGLFFYKERWATVVATTGQRKLYLLKSCFNKWSSKWSKEQVSKEERY